jgi:hypothetical protein
MTPFDIRGFLRKAPFEPFTLVVTNNERFDVYHPELLLVTQTMLALGLTKSTDPDAMAEQMVWLSPEHVLKIEPLKRSKAKGK